MGGCLRACIGVDGKRNLFTMIFTIFAEENIRKYVTI